MPVQDYLAAKKQARKEADTLLFRIRDAYNAAEEKLIGDDGLVDLASLDEPAKRDAFKHELVSDFWNVAREYFGMGERDFDQLDELKQDRLLFAYLGTSETGISSIIEGYKGNLTFDHFMEEIQKQIPERLKELQQYPLNKLSQTDAPEAVRYAGLKGKVNPEKLELRDIVGLIDNFERFGAVPPKFLENRPYLV